jgi:hypothetical protein
VRTECLTQSIPEGAARQSRNRTTRSVWSAWSLLPLSNLPYLMTVPASWRHSKRFAQQFIQPGRPAGIVYWRRAGEGMWPGVCDR